VVPSSGFALYPPKTGSASVTLGLDALPIFSELKSVQIGTVTEIEGERFARIRLKSGDDALSHDVQRQYPFDDCVEQPLHYLRYVHRRSVIEKDRTRLLGLVQLVAGRRSHSHSANWI